MILLRKARIYDKRSKHHQKRMDILIDQGVISRIAKSIKPDKKVKTIIESKSLCVSPGWLDIGTYSGEPGHEYREDLDSLRAAALRGGYVALAPFSAESPTLDNKGQLHYILSRNAEHPVQILPIATLTMGRKGKDMSEYADLANNGAIAFSDGNNSSLSMDQLQRSMMYLKSIRGLTIWSPSVHHDGQLHESATSVKMGLPGSPSLVEEARISTAIQQSEYTEAPLLIHNISTTPGLKMAKQSTNKAHLSFSVASLNLMKDAEDVSSFDLNLKVVPPLRDKATRRALTKAVQSGQIQVITSNHQPLSKEEKDQPFGMSMAGASTIETTYPSLYTLADIDVESLIHGLSIGPHAALGLECPVIDKGVAASLTLFDDQETYCLKESVSKGANTLFIDQELKGRVIGIITQRGYHPSSKS